MLKKRFALRFVSVITMIVLFSTVHASWWDTEEFFNAVKYGDTQAVTSSIKNGIDVNMLSDYGRTALMYASGRGHKDIVELLLKSGVDPNLKLLYGKTALTLALEGNYTEIVDILKKAGAKSAQQD